jgi:hypothetical protein
MDRRVCLVLLLLTPACRRGAGVEQLLPPTVADGWKRGAIVAAQGGPGQPAGALRTWNATYSGPGAIHVRLYEMNSSAGGLDATQRWKPAADTVVFHHEQYFVTARWENVNRAELTGFVRALEGHIREAR